MVVWVIIGVVWAALLVIAVGVCVVAARGDRAKVVDDAAAADDVPDERAPAARHSRGA